LTKAIRPAKIQAVRLAPPEQGGVFLPWLNLLNGSKKVTAKYILKSEGNLELTG
jgi:hypothetical protein